MKCESISFFCHNSQQEFVIAIVYLLTRRLLANEFSRKMDKNGKNREQHANIYIEKVCILL
jgi:hypothetical protein